MPYLRVYKPHFFDTNLPSKIGMRLIHGILKYLEKAVIIQTTEPMTSVLNVVKRPVETVSSRHHRLSIDSRKSEDRDITDKLPQMLLGIRKYFTFAQAKSSAAKIRVDIISKFLT
jgi:hypothetical protein